MRLMFALIFESILLEKTMGNVSVIQYGYFY